MVNNRFKEQIQKLEQKFEENYSSMRDELVNLKEPIQS